MQQRLMYVGTYTVRGSQGIYAYRFDSETGEMHPLGVAAESENPSFLVADRERSLIYSVEETSNYKGQPSGALRAYTADPTTGKLSLLNEVASLGTGPCYITLDKTGECVLVANYHSGSVAVFPRLADGRLGSASAFVQHEGASQASARQQGPHAHAIGTSSDNRFVLVADLGLDKLLIYRFDAKTGSLEDGEPAFATVKAGAGPRHFVFHPDGRSVYLLNELDSTVTHFIFDASTASLQTVRTVGVLPQGFVGHSHAAHLQIDGRGRTLYASNRGHDSIAVFAIDQEDSALTLLQHVSTQGKTPRGFSLDSTGQWLLIGNEDTDNIVTFRVSQETGTLTLHREFSECPSPVFFLFP
jgi:6-phosphogluconolactonase